MDIQQYLNNKKNLQKEIISILSKTELDDSKDFQQLVKCINDLKIHEDPNEFRLMLHLIKCISQHHHRSPIFFDIIEKILLMFQEDYNKYLTNTEIFNIFSFNKRIILFLLEHKIINMNHYISDYLIKVTEEKNYFFNEINQFIINDDDSKKSIEKENKEIEPNPEIFEQNRKIGENTKDLCSIIRNDSIDEFIVYVNKKNINLNTKIESNIFETNWRLIENSPSLIEYASFFGSLQIFIHLRLNNVKMNPNLWIYAIHGENPEIIHLIEESNIEPPENSYIECLKESIICHHNEIANYIINKYLEFDKFKEDESIKTQIIISHNYEFFSEEIINENSFYDLCRSDQFYLVKNILNNNKDFNAEFTKKCYLEELLHDSVSTPLFVSIANDNTNIVELLINRPEIDVNSNNLIYKQPEFENNYNPLLYAALFNNNKIVQLLINHPNIDVNIKSFEKVHNINGTNTIEECHPFIEAINVFNIEIIKILLSSDQFNINTVFRKYDNNSSIYDDCISIVEETTLMFYAIIHGYIEIVKLLLSYPKIDVNIKSKIKNDDDDNDDGDVINETFLCFAIRKNKTKIAKLLLENPRIDVNDVSTYEFRDDNSINEKTALILAFEKENIEIIELLLKIQSINVNCKLVSYKNQLLEQVEIYLLHCVIIAKNEKIFKLLLTNPKINVNLKSVARMNEYGKISIIETPTIKLLLKYGNIEMARALLATNKLNLKMKSRQIELTEDSLINLKDDELFEIANQNNNSEVYNLLFEEKK